MSNSDWIETTVGDVVIESFSGPSPTCDERNTEGEEWGVLKTTCATVERGWDWTRHKVLPRSFWGNERSLIRAGDTVITKAGPRHRVAVPAYVDFVPPRILVSGKMVGLRPNPAAIHPRFLALALSDVRTQTFLDERTTGMAESQVNFENATLLEAPLFLPPLGEQQAIAEALSDADVLVKSLDALIAKKRDMKQAAMQQLLTGRTRLPGFSDEWFSLLIGDIASLSAAPAKMSGGSQYVIVDMGSVAKDGSLLTHKKTDKKDDLLEVGDLVMPKDDIGGGQIIGKAVYIDVPDRYVLGDHVYRLRLSEGHPPYVRYAINSHSVNSSLRSKVVGSAQLGLGRRSVLEQPILFPPLDEQKAIAEVLSDMDAEIDALVAQREKADLVKHGMTQELLSGRVRLA